MTELEKAARMALEALTKNSDRVTEIRAKDQAITALRDALAEQPAQEPVAWRSWNDHDGYGFWDTKHEAEPWCAPDFFAEPLYTSPPVQRKPLGFAGVTGWVGNAVATQIVTEVAIQCERIPSQSITMAAQRCVEMLAAHGITSGAATLGEKK